MAARLKLFEAVVSSTILYGCECWTLRIDQQRRLVVLQRKMLRMVLNAKRRTMPTSSDTNASADSSDHESESQEMKSWADFMKRTAKWTDEQLAKAGIRQGVVQWKRRKWQWAAKLMA